MPRATLDIQEIKKYDLKTCAGGYVVLRRMSFGDILQRRSMQMNLSMQMAEGQKQASVDIDMDTGQVAQFEFAKCIAEHNLEDHTGRTLNFNSPVDFRLLDPRIGQEIEAYIEDMNNFELTPDFTDESNTPSSPDASWSPMSVSQSSLQTFAKPFVASQEQEGS